MDINLTGAKKFGCEELSDFNQQKLGRFQEPHRTILGMVLWIKNSLLCACNLSCFGFIVVYLVAGFFFPMYVRFLFELVFSSPILLMLLDLVEIVCLCYSFKNFQWKAS